MELTMKNKAPALPVGRLNSPMWQGVRGKLTAYSLDNSRLASTNNYEISHKRDRWRRMYYPEGNLFVVTVAYPEFFHIVSRWHGGISDARKTSMVPMARPGPPRWQQSYYKIRCWHASCLMGKTYLYWYHCSPFLSDLKRLYVNTVVDWAHTYATLVNVSYCWIHTKFSFSASVGLPWHTHAANVTAWDRLTYWGPQLPNWRVIRTWVDTQRRTRHGLDEPLLVYSIHDGWSWPISEGVEVNGDVPIVLKETQGPDCWVGCHVLYAKI